MRAAVLLHAAAVVHGPQPLHPADENLVAACRLLGLEVVAVELVGAQGVGPCAMNDALEAGAERGVRLVAESLAAADAHATGLAAERVLRTLDVALILFAPDADPEGLADVPAVIAWRLGSAYLPGVVEIGAPAAAALGRAGGDAHLEAVVDRAGALVRVQLPPAAVVGLEADATVSGRGVGADPTPGVRAPAAPSAIRILTLPEIGLEPTLLRRGDDLRGVIEPAARPLVTTRSVESLATLLR